jgi:hypothetical protein
MEKGYGALHLMNFFIITVLQILSVLRTCKTSRSAGFDLTGLGYLKTEHMGVRHLQDKVQSTANICS